MITSLVMQPVDIGSLRTAYLRVRAHLQSLVRPRSSRRDENEGTLPSRTPPLGTSARNAAADAVRRKRGVEDEAVPRQTQDPPG